MLTKNHKRREILNYFDILLRTHNFEYQASRFRRYLKRKGKRDRLVYWTYELTEKTSKQRLFLVCIHYKNTPKDKFVQIPVIRVETNHLPVYITRVEDTGNPCLQTPVIISTHFLKRYAERTKRPFIFPSIVGDYLGNECSSALVYEDKEKGNLVYASKSGLSLSTRRGGIVNFCTFVSMDLLKESQLNAWKEVYYINAENAFNNRLQNNYALANNSAFNRAEEIYAEFFKNAIQEEELE